MAYAINAKGIFKTFHSGWWKKRHKEALKGVDLQVEEREIFGILGPNRRGKTTLYRFSAPYCFQIGAMFAFGHEWSL